MKTKKTEKGKKRNDEEGTRGKEKIAVDGVFMERGQEVLKMNGEEKRKTSRRSGRPIFAQGVLCNHSI